MVRIGGRQPAPAQAAAGGPGQRPSQVRSSGSGGGGGRPQEAAPPSATNGGGAPRHHPPGRPAGAAAAADVSAQALTPPVDLLHGQQPLQQGPRAANGLGGFGDDGMLGGGGHGGAPGGPPGGPLRSGSGSHAGAEAGCTTPRQNGHPGGGGPCMTPGQELWPHTLEVRAAAQGTRCVRALRLRRGLHQHVNFRNAMGVVSIGRVSLAVAPAPSGAC